MKQYYIVETGKQLILYVGRGIKVEKYARLREGSYRLATKEEIEYAKKHKLVHLNSFKMTGAEEVDVQEVDHQIAEEKVGKPAAKKEEKPVAEKEEELVKKEEENAVEEVKKTTTRKAKK